MFGSLRGYPLFAPVRGDQVTGGGTLFFPDGVKATQGNGVPSFLLGDEAIRCPQ